MTDEEIIEAMGRRMYLELTDEERKRRRRLRLDALATVRLPFVCGTCKAPFSTAEQILEHHKWFRDNPDTPHEPNPEN